MDQYIEGAEKQLYVLQRSLPVGAVARKYPQEEEELRQLFAHSELGLQELAVAEAKKEAAEKVVLCQIDVYIALHSCLRLTLHRMPLILTAPRRSGCFGL